MELHRYARNDSSAEALFAVVDDERLPWVECLLRFNERYPYSIFSAENAAFLKRLAIPKSGGIRPVLLRQSIRNPPRVLKKHFARREQALLFEALGYGNRIAHYVLAHNIVRPVGRTFFRDGKAVPLAYGVEESAFMLSDLLSLLIK